MKVSDVMRGLLFLGAVLATAGCLNFTKSYPDKRSFVLEVASEQRESLPGTARILRISRVRVSPLFAGRAMVYRVAELQYDNDFYNEWLVAPGSLLSEQFYAWISKSGRFRVVVAATDHVEPTHVLEARVTEFYGDYRKGIASAAVFGVEVRLLDQANDGQVLFQRTYHKEVPLHDQTPEALAIGLSSAVRRVLVDFEQDALVPASETTMTSGP